MTAGGRRPDSVTAITKHTNSGVTTSGAQPGREASMASPVDRVGIDRLTFTARRRFLSSSARSYVTMSPSSGARCRSEIAVMCTNRGSPPPAGVIDPKPRSAFQLVTFPFCRALIAMPPFGFVSGYTLKLTRHRVGMPVSSILSACARCPRSSGTWPRQDAGMNGGVGESTGPGVPSLTRAILACSVLAE